MIDFTSASIDFSIIAPEIVLLVTAFIILLTVFFKNANNVAAILGFVGLAISVLFVIGQVGQQQSGFFGMITCDHFGVSFKMIFSLISMFSLLLAKNFMEKKGIERPEFYALLLISTMGMMVMANSTDLVVIFIGLEILSVPLYVMAGFARRSLESNEAGIKYFIMGAFASAFLLLGIAFIYGAAATTDLRQIVTDFSYIIHHNKFYLLSGISLILVGFGFKVGAVPFHSWVPDVYQGAPTPVTAFFSVGPKAAGFAALLRIFGFGFGELHFIPIIFWGLAVLTMSIGNVLALLQTNVKRLLAYSSIAHAGYIFVALAVNTPESISSAIFYLVAYALFNLGAFSVIIMLESRTGGTSNLADFAGMAKKHPYLSAVLALFMFALAGFPPTIGFIGKFYIFSQAVKVGNSMFYWLTIIGVMNSFLSVYYYLKVVKTAYFDKPDKEFKPLYISPAVMIVLVLTVLGTLGLGFFPTGLFEITQRSFFAIL